MTHGEYSASRPIRLAPTAPGFWPLTLGVCIAALAPLFGFLVGVTTGRPDGDALFGPLYWGLFTGIVIGGIGVLMAVVGGVRLWRHQQRTRAEDTVRTVDAPVEAGERLS